MHLGHQLADVVPFSDHWLGLCAELGVEQVVVHTSHATASQHERMSVFDETGAFDAQSLIQLRQYIEGYGLYLGAVHLDLGTLHADLALNRNHDKSLSMLAMAGRNIAAAADSGIPALKYNLQIIGIPRTGDEPGRGAARYSSFNASTATSTDVHKYSIYLNEDQDWNTPGISAEQSWSGIEAILSSLLPVAQAEGVYLACHPQDPPFPPEGLFGVAHVLGSVSGLERLLAFSDTQYHVLNFCQGTIAEMCDDPATGVIAAIRQFGRQNKIYMVHFRNIAGSYLSFSEVHIDNGRVDMAEALRAYRDVGFAGMLVPDHVPSSDHDPDGEAEYAFALGYVRGLLQAEHVQAAAWKQRIP
jgi:mannonate dehydratase